MDRKFEKGTDIESFGLPTDLITDPEKYDGDIPFWKRTVNFFRQYQKSNHKGKQALLEQITHSIVKEPAILLHLIRNFDLWGQVSKELDPEELKEQLLVQTENTLVRRLNLSTWTPPHIEELVGLCLDGRKQVTTGASATPKTSNLIDLIQRITPSPYMESAPAPDTFPLQPMERFISALFNAPRTVEDAVDLYYNAVWAMVTTTHADIREEIFSILCLEKPWLNEESTSSIYFEEGMFSADDIHLAKYFAVVEALNSVGKLLEMGKLYSKAVTGKSIHSERAERRYKKMDDALDWYDEAKRSIVNRALLSQSGKNPKRFNQLTDLEALKQEGNDWDERIAFYQNQGMSFYDAIVSYNREILNRPWPENVKKDPNEPLRRILQEYFSKVVFKALWEQQKIDLAKQGYQQLTPQNLQISDGISLDILAKGIETPEQRDAVVRMVTEYILGGSRKATISSNNSVFSSEESMKLFDGLIRQFDADRNIIFSMRPISDDETTGTLASILEYRRPLISLHQTKAMENKIARVRMEIMNNFVRSITKRGYSVVINDPALRHLGYEAIEFKKHSDNSIAVNITIVGEQYTFFLDSDQRIKLGGDLLRFGSAQDKAWLELLTLSHLRRLICIEEDEEILKAEMIGGQRQYEKYRRQVGRSEHLRRQQPGPGYTTEAFNKCLKSNLPIKNLHLINRMKAEIGKGGTKETGIWTYVSGIEYVDAPDAKPVKVAFKGASDDINAVIPLGQISQEEISRLEEDILQEMGY